MTSSEGFSRKPPDELSDYLLEVARRQRAPQAARQRTLARVSQVAAGGLVAMGTKTALAGAAQSSAHWLAAKWFVIGLGTALGALTAAEQARLHLRSSAPVEPAREASPAASVAALPALPETEPIAAELPVSTSAKVAAPRVSADAPVVGVESAAEGSSVAAPSFEPPTMERLSREVELLKQARSALARGAAAPAARALSDYRGEFPSGVLAIEAAALEVELAVASGDRTRAEALSQAFLRDHAASPLAARVRALQKP